MKYNPDEIIAINGSHDCSVTFIDKNSKIRIYEYERFNKKRYAMFTSSFDSRPSYGSNDIERGNFITHIKNNLKNQNIKLILYQELNDRDKVFLNLFFPNAEFKKTNHHESHAFTGIHLSNYNECLVFSIDGGGWDYEQVSTTNIYLYKNNKLTLLEKNPIDFGGAYYMSAYLISELPLKTPGDLSIAGRLMGLTAYGNVIDEWIEPMRELYRTHDIQKMCDTINIPNIPKSLEGQISYDFVRTSQYVFESELFKIAKNYIDTYNLNVIMVGGCALNVLFNQKLYEYLKDKNLSMYVPPNPNDCGLSYGMYVIENKDASKEEICFSGLEILDEDEEVKFNNPSEELDLTKLVDYLSKGKIIGILDGNSEVGPRALGNRSIICYPAFKEMKDILNHKVKFREWFRPFAPVCKYEEKDKYFINAPECDYMSYAPKVKEEFQEKLSSITHADKTSRLQTVKDNCLFYDILSEMGKQGIIPVLLNTSFNIKGYPILSTAEDAFYCLNNTEMDFLVYKNKIYKK